MATSTAPSTPIHHPSIQRSFTLPSKLGSPAKSPLAAKSPGGDSIETLFVHGRGKIVSFSPSLSAQKSKSISAADTVNGQDRGGVLPWRSHSERTRAAGVPAPHPVLVLYSNLPFRRSPQRLQGKGYWHRISQLWRYHTSNSSQISVLVCRRGDEIRAPHKEQ